MSTNRFSDELYEFNAPKKYIDFSNFQDDDDDNADDFFDCGSELTTRSKSLQNLNDEGPESNLETDEKMETEVSPEQSDEDKENALSNTPSKENEDANKIITRSARKGPLGNDGIFLDPPVRYSPRLAAIGKVRSDDHHCLQAVSNSSGKSKSGFKGQRRSVSVGPSVQRSRVGGGSLNNLERKALAEIASVNSNDNRKSRERTCTKPREFKFATDSRIKNSSTQPSTSDKVPSAATFAKCLRTYAASSTAAKQKGPTKVQPFKLTHNKKSPNENDENLDKKNKFVSLAELNMKYYCKTPDRFRTKPKNDFTVPLKRNGSNSSLDRVCHLTKPQSPALKTRSRSRPVTHLTREEEEEKAFLEAKQHQVKSKPVNPKIFKAPKLPDVPKKEATLMKPFAITDTAKEEEQKSQLDEQSQLDDESQLDDIDFMVEDLNLPHTGVRTVDKKTNTKVKPFSFDTRDQQRYKMKDIKIQEELKKQKSLAEFHAHPMPVFDGGPKGLPGKKPLAPTKVKAFDLNIDKRGEQRQKKLEQERKEREMKEREGRQFHARPAKVVTQEAFVPVPSTRAPTTVSDFALSTSTRSEQRLQFDMQRKMREDMLLAEKMRLEEQLQNEELARIAEKRRTEMTHKSRPMPEFPTPVLVPTTKPLTVAAAPEFATDERLRRRRNSNGSSICSSRSNLSSIGN